MVTKSHNPSGVFVLLLIVFCTCAAAFAGQEPAQNAPAQAMDSAQQRLQTKITLTTRPDAPIAAVIAQLADQAGVSIVTSPAVTGTVPAMKVTNVPLGELLNNILAAYGYTYVATENMVRVIPLSEVAPEKEKLITRIYRLTYADIVDVAKSLESFKSKRGEITFSKGTSNLMVTDVESKIEAIDKFITEIDRITQQVMVEVRVYDITSNEGFILDQAWAAARNVPVTAIDHTNIHTQDTGGITGYDIDTSGDVPIVTETQTAEDRVTDTTTKTDSTVLRGKPWVGGGFSKEQGGVLGFSILNDAVQIQLLLNILQQNVGVELIANPRILVLDNEAANFKIVREIPYEERSEGTGSRTLTTVRFKDVGVKLDVTPHIARDDMIRLDVAPEFGVQETTIKGGLDSMGAPQVNTRRIETTTLIKDGQTIALGGLRRRDNREIIRKVPVLSDLPLLGNLFVSRVTTDEAVELVIFITARIVTQPILTGDEREQFDATNIPGPKPPRKK